MKQQGKESPHLTYDGSLCFVVCIVSMKKQTISFQNQTIFNINMAMPVAYFPMALLLPPMF